MHYLYQYVGSNFNAASPSAVIGFDIGSDPQRLAALEHARDNNAPTGTGVIFSITTNAKLFTVYMPIYKENVASTSALITSDITESRRKNLVGFGQISIQTQPFFESLLKTNILKPDMNFIVYDNAPLDHRQFLFSTNKNLIEHPTAPSNYFTKVVQLPLVEEKWNFHFQAKPDFGLTNAEKSLPSLVLFGGLTLSGLLFATIYLLINSRKRALLLANKMTEQLRENETKFKSILDNMSEGLVAVGTDGKFQFINHAAEVMMGPMTQAPSNDWEKIYTLYLPDKITPLALNDFPLTKALRGIESRNIELYIKNSKEGTGVFIASSSNPLKDSQGKVTGAIAVFNNITLRKEAEEKMLTEKAKAEAILGSIGEGMIVTDIQGSLLVINKIACDMLGIVDEALVKNKNIIDTFIFYNKDSQPIPTEKRPLYLALHTGQKVEETLEYHLPNGNKEQLHITANPILLQGETGGVIMMIRDVTKEKKVDRMKTEFISLASHQLRTPLTAIKWFTEMLLSGEAGSLQPEQKEFTKNISQSTQRMIELVNALLNISRMESGRIVVDPRPTDLRELVTGIVNDLKAKKEEKKQNLIISVHEGLPKINVDPKLLGQVYLNLLTNAIKYTPKGGDISVLISKKGDQLLSQISDSGYGIPKAQQENVFQKFFRADNIAKIEIDGTGLGLYLIKSIIDSSGGKIWFESEENKGTTFWFTLPMTGMNVKEGEVSLAS